MSFRNGKFGLLTIQYAVTPDIFQCECKCGNTLEVWRSLLANNVQRDCGMCRWKPGRRGHCRTGHARFYWTRDGRGLSYKSAELNTWTNMIGRCTNKRHHAYADYGGRGIRVCKRWSLPHGWGFKNFIDDMGVRPQGLTLDRVNPQGHYDPTNCRWADRDEQNNNRRHQRWPNGNMPKVEGVRSMESRMEEFNAMEARLQAEAMELSGFYA